MTESQISNLRPFISRPAVKSASLVVILLLAAFLRVYLLDDVPPGFTHDEAGHGQDAIAILNGARPIYQTVGYGREPLYDYLVAGLMALFGPTGSVLRFSPVPLSLLTLLATYLWVRLAFDRPTALAATALQAVSFWPLAVGRQALRSGLLPALFAFAVYFYWRSWGESKLKGDAQASSKPSLPRPYSAALCALFIGATLWTYIPARVTWIVFPAFLAYLALAHRQAFRRAWLLTLVAVLIGLLLAAPLFVYLQAHPEAEQRLAMLDEPLQALKSGDFSVILGRAWSCVTGFFIPGRGDRFLAYNIPGRPTFDSLTGVLFLVGVGLCLARWQRPACAFALIWLLVGISPSLITGATASFTRSIAALPVAFLFPALAVVEGTRWAAARWGQRAAGAVGAVFAVAVIAIGAASAHAYFVTWGESPEVRDAYKHTLVEMADYLDTAPAIEGVGISTYLPHAPHDPCVFDMRLQRDDLSLRWFDGERAIVLPAEESGWLVVPARVPLDPYFADLPGFRVRERVMLREDDLDPFFDVYEWEPQVALAALQARMHGEPVSFAPSGWGQNGALRLLGYNLRTPQVAPGGTVELVTLWRVLDPEPLRPQNPSDAEEDLVFFTHALNEAGNIVGQEDRLDAPAWDWQAEDVIAQIHRFTLPADLSEEPVTLEVGVYRRSDGARLPVVMDGSIAGDRVLLQSLEIVSEWPSHQSPIVDR
jgi:4-amino-4-deoxy-L-arabinose transferase-like glycosyltransferase